jgi:hypothetical protein
MKVEPGESLVWQLPWPDVDHVVAKYEAKFSGKPDNEQRKVVEGPWDKPVRAVIITYRGPKGVRIKADPEPEVFYPEEDDDVQVQPPLEHVNTNDGEGEDG